MNRADAEKILVKRLKRLMSAAGLSQVFDGNNDDLDDPFMTALQEMDLPADLPLTDDHFAAVVIADVREYLLRAEIRLLTNIKGNIEGSDISMTTGKSENRSQLVAQVTELLELANAKLTEVIDETESETASGGILVGGKVALDFQEDISAWYPQS